MALNTPTPEQFWRLFEQGTAAGLTVDAAYAYAALNWWGLHFGKAPGKIVSGYRSEARQRELQQRWDAGDRAGLKVRPVTGSKHSQRVAWDESGTPDALKLRGALVAYLPGVRWGGNFTTRDDVHFDLGG